MSDKTEVKKLLRKIELLEIDNGRLHGAAEYWYHRYIDDPIDVIKHSRRYHNGTYKGVRDETTNER